jgi:hypothetical protein
MWNWLMKTIITDRFNWKVYKYLLSIILYTYFNRCQAPLITHQKTKCLLDEGDISAQQVCSFYKAARAFFVKAVEYSMKNLQLHDLLLQNACFVNFEKRINADALQSQYFISMCVLNNYKLLIITSMCMQI